MATHAEHLDEVLDSSALDDIQNLNLMRSMQKDFGNSDDRGGETVPTTKVQGLGLGLPGLELKKKMGAKQEDADSYVFETPGKLRQQTEKSFRGLEESAGVATTTTTTAGGLGDDGLLNPQMLDEWVKQFEELAGPQGMDSLTENTMQKLLSKEILHQPLKEIAERYPKWLTSHKEKLSDEDYERYSLQYEVMRELIGVYERDPSNFKMIVELMQKMQECGQPPNDIVQELTPDIDLSQLGQISASWPLY